MGVLKEQYLPQYTIEDYMSWGGDWELIHGIPFAMSPSPSVGHQRTGRNVLYVLDESIKQAECKCEIFYELDWHVKEDTVVRPDLLVLCGPNIPDDFVTQVPPLVVEILSESTAKKDRTLKEELYAVAGVRCYVLIDYQKREIEINLLTDGKYRQVDLQDSIHLGECVISPEWSKVFE